MRELLYALKQWQIAVKDYAKANPNPTVARKRLDEAREKVLNLLENETISLSINSFIEESRSRLSESPEDLEIRITANREKIAKDEVKSVKPIELEQEDVSELISAYLKLKDNQDRFIDSTESSIRFFTAAHNSSNVLDS